VTWWSYDCSGGTCGQNGVADNLFCLANERTRTFIMATLLQSAERVALKYGGNSVRHSGNAWYFCWQYIWEFSGMFVAELKLP